MTKGQIFADAVLPLKSRAEDEDDSDAQLFEKFQLTTAEWKLVQGACTLMEPVKEATLKLEAEIKPTICNVVEQVFIN